MVSKQNSVLDAGSLFLLGFSCRISPPLSGMTTSTPCFSFRVVTKVHVSVQEGVLFREKLVIYEEPYQRLQHVWLNNVQNPPVCPFSLCYVKLEQKGLLYSIIRAGM